MTTAAPGDPTALLRAAQVVIDRRHSATRGVWPKAAALLGRQALETAISQRFPEIANASGRARNLCLPTLLGDRELARDLIQSWGALSRATHYHAYDLSPTATELEHWLEPVARLIDQTNDPR